MLRERSVSNTVRSTVVSIAKELSKLTTWTGRIFGQYSKKEPTCQGCLLWHTFVRTRTRLPSCEGQMRSICHFPCFACLDMGHLGHKKTKVRAVFPRSFASACLGDPMTNRPSLVLPCSPPIWRCTHAASRSGTRNREPLVEVGRTAILKRTVWQERSNLRPSLFCTLAFVTILRSCFAIFLDGGSHFCP